MAAQGSMGGKENQSKQSDRECLNPRDTRGCGDKGWEEGNEKEKRMEECDRLGKVRTGKETEGRGIEGNEMERDGREMKERESVKKE